MAKQKISLLDAMTQAVDEPPKRPTTSIKSVKPITEPKQKPAQPDASSSDPSTKYISARFDMATWQQWNIIGIEQGGRTTQDMMEEALNDFFIKHGKSSIA